MQVNFLTENQNIIHQVNQFIEEWNSPNELIIVKTSGSTGIPKEITLHKKHMIASANMTGDFLGLNKNNRALLCLSPNTIAGKMMIVRSIVLGMQLTVIDINSNPLGGLIQVFDFVAMVPMQLQNSIQKEIEVLSKIKTIIVGGGIVSEGLSAKIPDLACNVYHTFGMTETISHIAMRNLTASETKYEALPNVSFDIDNECLVINAPDLGVKGLKTNDIVDLLSPTSFIWKGRQDFAINSGGVKIHPEQVEAKLSAIIDHPFFITGLDDPRYGSKVVLCIQSNSDLTFTKSQFTSCLSQYQIPKEIYFFDDFVKTKSDKINRIQTLKLITDAKKQVL